MKEIYINTDDYNSDSIRTIQGNNNAEEYKIYLQYDNEKIDLTNKTVNLGFLKIGSTEGDIIENLNVTDPKNGEITLKITNKLSKKNGTYSCQLAILGEGDFLEHTATFTLTVENNIFSDITKAIADSKDFTYLENILDKASKLNEKLKENTSSATNANSNLESNITEANNINSKLLENTSTATGLNKNLESNIDLAKEVKETIKDLDTKNIEATSKIERLEGLNTKAEELSDNINKGLPLNSELIKNVESAKTANNELIATNNDAKTKKTDLDNSLEEAKKYIAGLDGSKNPVQMQLDINELKNGLKSNQALAYKGSSIAANNTLEGRTEGMMINGKTLVNLAKPETFSNAQVCKVSLQGNYYNVTELTQPPSKGALVFNVNLNKTLNFGKTYTAIILETTISNKYLLRDGKNSVNITKVMANNVFSFTVEKETDLVLLYYYDAIAGDKIKSIKNIIILEGDWTNEPIPQYFEGLKSFGEEEQEGDKYKVSILSCGKNLYTNKIEKVVNGTYELLDNGFIAESTFYTSVQIPKLDKNKIYYLTFDKEFISGNSKGSFYAIIYDETIKSSVVKDNLTGNDKIVFTERFNPNNNNKLYFYTGSGTASKVKFTNIQLKEGTGETSYEQYKCNKKNILIKEPLREWDTLYEDNGQIKVYRKAIQYIFTGNENIAIRGNSLTNTMSFAYRLDNKSNKLICNNFTNIGGWDKDKERIWLDGNNLMFHIQKSRLKTQDVEGFKTWLKDNQTEIVYELATPVTEVVDGVIDIDLDTFGEKTYFNILNSLPGTLDFKVPSNIGSSLQNLAKEVNNIWDVINNLLVPSIVKANGNIAMIKLNNNLK